MGRKLSCIFVFQSVGESRQRCPPSRLSQLPLGPRPSPSALCCQAMDFTRDFSTAASSLLSPGLLCLHKWLKLPWRMPRKSKQVAADSLDEPSGLYTLSSRKAAGVFLLEGRHDKCQQIFPRLNASLGPSG